MIFATITGNLGRDAEMRDAGGYTVCKFSVASTSKRKGEKITTWVSCDLWGKRGESLCQHLKKGNKITVAGEIEMTENNGKTYLNCRVADVDPFCGGGSDRNQQRSGTDTGGGSQDSGGGYSDTGGGSGSDDLPF